MSIHKAAPPAPELVSKEPRVIKRAYRCVLDPNQEQLASLARHAGAQRWAYNYAIAAKKSAHAAYSQAVAEATYEVGADPNPEIALPAARKLVKANREHQIPGFIDLSARWRRECGDSRTDTEGIAPWWWEVSSYCFSSGLRAADAAWTNWLDGLSGKRAGRMGSPRFHAKGKSRDSFAIYHDRKKPSIRIDDARHVRIPRLGTIRTHTSQRRLIRKQQAGLIDITSVTISRQGHRWIASVLVEETARTASKPSRRQCAAGMVGVDVGVHHLAALSDGDIIANPRHLRAAQARLTKAQRALSRTQRGSQGRLKASRRVGRLHAQLAERRTQHLHQLTKRLATNWQSVAIEDLNVRGMTASARGTVEKPGRNVRQKAGLNKSILDVSFAEIRRQLGYKTGWYGSELCVIGRWTPTSKTCSRCRAALPEMTLAVRTIHCSTCGLTLDRDINAAINIAAAATQISPDRGEHQPETTAKPKPLSRSTVRRSQPNPCDKREPEAHSIGTPDEHPPSPREMGAMTSEDPRGHPAPARRRHPTQHAEAHQVSHLVN